MLTRSQAKLRRRLYLNGNYTVQELYRILKCYTNEKINFLGA